VAAAVSRPVRMGRLLLVAGCLAADSNAGLAMGAAEHDLPLSTAYRRYYRRWLALGCRHSSRHVIFYLMVAKPDVSVPW